MRGEGGCSGHLGQHPRAGWRIQGGFLLGMGQKITAEPPGCCPSPAGRCWGCCWGAASIGEGKPLCPLLGAGMFCSMGTTTLQPPSSHRFYGDRFCPHRQHRVLSPKTPLRLGPISGARPASPRRGPTGGTGTPQSKGKLRQGTGRMPPAHLLAPSPNPNLSWPYWAGCSHASTPGHPGKARCSVPCCALSEGRCHWGAQDSTDGMGPPTTR